MLKTSCGFAAALLVLLSTLSCLPREVRAPLLSDTRPADYDGLHNVVAYADGFYSGSVPEGDAGFETLRKLGIRTIVSVDGAAPNLEAAKSRGMRYVHLPIGYNGMDKKRTLEIARAAKELPGPIYIHCHHGKHRSTCAAGAAVVTLGWSTSDEAARRMKVSGTSTSYPGLYACVAMAAVATSAELDAADDTFPEVWKTSGMVKSMVEIDHAFEHLKEIQKAGWKVPKDHPDLVPAAEAGKAADQLRYLAEDEEAREETEEFRSWLLEGSRLAESLEAGLVDAADGVTLDERLKRVDQSCRQCHAAYRDLYDVR